jgi:RNA polymerase sigma factor (sigma-70 family)
LSLRRCRTASEGEHHDLSELPLLPRVSLRGLHLHAPSVTFSPSNAGGGSGPPALFIPMSETVIDRLLAQRKQFLAFVSRRVPDPQLAEDILQTAYLRAVEHRDDFEPGESAVAWFYRLLRNAVIDSYRRHASRSKALEVWTRELETSAQPSPEVEREVCSCIHGILDGLKPEYAEVLRAVDLKQQRVQDFAGEHRITASNAGVRIHRARAAFRKQLLKTCATCAEHQCVNCTCDRHSPSCD